MYKILYVHGLGGTKNGFTGNALKSLVQENNINAEVITEDFPLEPLKWIQKINDIVLKEKINSIVSSSLGAFMTMYYKKMLNPDIQTILINPCMFPEVDLPKNFGYGKREYRGERTDGEKYYCLTDDLYNQLGKMTLELYKENGCFNNAIAFFSENDEFFKHEKDYDTLINKNHYYVLNATHHFNGNDLKTNVLPKIREILSSI